MNFDDILCGLTNLRALVVGDICLDRWCTYNPSLAVVSRETNIPRVAVVQTLNTPGAGGTIAKNLTAMGVETVNVLGCIGDDGNGFELLRALQTHGIAPDLVIRQNGMATFTYTKLINASTGTEDLPRVDFVNHTAIDPRAQDKVTEALEQHIEDFDVVLVSDQAETDEGGVVGPSVRASINELAQRYPDKVIWVDSRLRPEHFRHVVVKPNDDEADAACQRLFGGGRDYQALADHGSLRLLVVTHGAEGVELFGPNGHARVPGRPVVPVDICGAGDSFSAGAACALALGVPPQRAAAFGNLVASITVTKPGTGFATPDELRQAAETWNV